MRMTQLGRDIITQISRDLKNARLALEKNSILDASDYLNFAGEQIYGKDSVLSVEDTDRFDAEIQALNKIIIQLNNKAQRLLNKADKVR